MTLSLLAAAAGSVWVLLHTGASPTLVAVGLAALVVVAVSSWAAALGCGLPV